ncbi:MFS transporter [Bartonella sp. HY761]|uniref:MFS transporter n=1 Tax=Bartonella sp. HY761 TaxID=2979330 RepID=UPI00220A5AC4|nr:MFS transporter [Bartonella sp. HY761]UXN07392.1 MFS transporter [Bartonella sp. HY761]
MYIIIGSAIILALSLGIRHGFGLYLVPMSHEFGWGHNVFSLAIAMQNLLWGIVQPFTGAFSDKYGAKRTVLIGGVLYSLGLMLMAISSSGIMLNLSLGVILGVALSATSFSVLLSAVGRAAPVQKRGLAMGMASAAGSLGQFIMLPSTLLLIQNYGWSTSLLISAVLSALIIPLAFLLKNPQSSKGAASLAKNKQQASLKEVIGIAIKYKPFLFLSLGFFVCGFQVVFIGIHMPGYLIDNGFDNTTGTIFLALVGLFNIVGTYLAGWLGDKYSKPHLLMALYGLRGVAIIIFLTMPLTTYSVYLFGAVMGILWLSTVPLTNNIVANIFGVRYLTTLVGLVFFTHQVGSFFGGWLGGVNHDLTGNYTNIWIFAIFLSLVGVAVHFFVNEKAIIHE